MIVGYAYVCGDILHVGHLQHLKNCKQFCDKLVVGVLTDEAVMERKVKPVLSFTERLRLVEALRWVDIAIPQNTYSPIPNALSMEVDILFESTSHKEEDIEDAKIKLSKIGSKVLVMPYFPVQSSTNIKEIIKNGK
jgi:glycerol-3-phosphate cytidylyltransferase